MAKKKGSRKTTKKKTGGRSSRRRSGTGYKPGAAKGKNVVIVESPSKARTINRYLGDDYVVLASVGHVRDLPAKAPKGSKMPVPGVDLDHGFTPTYEVLSGKDALVRELRRAAEDARGSGGDVWFATDLDREGEAIAWHLAQELDIAPEEAKRVIFSAITSAEIRRAFSRPHPIDIDKVNAQQARRILDRIVGYQVSPLLWKKVARGLSAGRVQSVAVRLIVEREREIRVFVPDEYWSVQGIFALSEEEARRLGPAWGAFLEARDEKGNPPTVKSQNAWLSARRAFRGELVEIDGEKFDLRAEYANAPDAEVVDLSDRVRRVCEAAGMTDLHARTEEDAEGKGPARWKRTLEGEVDPGTPYRVRSIETKRTTSRPSAPFITSTLQQAASTRLGFAAQRTMRAAQSLYEGVDIPGEGPVGLITYMRTDSTNVAPEAVQSVRNYIRDEFGERYLPEKPQVYASSNKSAQEAHEAIRPTSLAYPPRRVKSALSADQFRLYELIWSRFVASQMVPAEWDATTVLIDGGREGSVLTFKATGRVLVFDGCYRASGVPTATEEATLPELEEGRSVSPLAINPQQKFTQPPPRYTEASLIRTLEAEGIGRPSTYAEIIQKIQDRKYVELIERRFHATDLGEVVTDKLIEAFPRIMDVSYTRRMEAELDKIEEDHLDWVEMLQSFYAPFAESLERAHDELAHAKAETQPSEYACEKCGAPLVYRFGKNGRFLSCSRYPDCDYASPIDRRGRPRRDEIVNVRCPRTGRAMVRRTGRFGPFLATRLREGESQDVGMILNIDRKGHVTAPAPPPLETDLVCPKCGEHPLSLRSGARGPWLGCSSFPGCRGRGRWAELPDERKAELEARLEVHEREHPIPVIRTLDGRPLTDAKGKPLPDAPRVDELVLDEDDEQRLGSVA